MTTERDRCLDLLVEGMLGCVTFHHDIPDARLAAIKAAMRETADSFLSVWDDSKARGGRLIVNETAWTEGHNVANGATLSKWVKGRAAEPGESADGLREYDPHHTLQRAPITYPARRCAGPDCGDKIKHISDDDFCWVDAEGNFYHRGCVNEERGVRR
jgi:hypothetical protein